MKNGRRGAITGAVTVAALALAGGIAYATIPDNNKVFTACMLNNIGTIRLIDKSLPSTNLMSHCTDKESEVSWNQKGQNGAPGLPGATGPAGPAGPAGRAGPAGGDGEDSGPAFSTATVQPVALPSNGSVPVLQLAVDPGAYVFTASVSVLASGASPVFCYLRDDGAPQEVSQVVDDTVPAAPNPPFLFGRATLTVVAAHDFAGATTVSLQCGAPAASQFSPAATASLVAVKVRSIN